MSEFFFLTHDRVDPQFNIASEEYLLKNTNGFYVYLWRNAPAVIVGVNQNALEEINLDFVSNSDIKVVRRITGGGTVYHDLNNVCYTVIAPFDSQKDNYKLFTAPVIEYLNSLGVKAEFSGRNDITVNGKKISGNAQTVYKDRIMHHGTLLFKTDMNALSSALKPSKLKIESKGIKSVRARVTNIYDELPVKMTAQEFFDGLKAHLSNGLKEYSFAQQDLTEINRLIEQKFGTFEWNIGRSPAGKNAFEGRFNFGTLKISFDTVDGKIQNACINGDFFSLKPITDFASSLNGVAFDKNSLIKAFERLGEFIQGADGNQVVNSFLVD